MIQENGYQTERGCIDILKLIFALFIVGLHTGVLNIFPKRAEWIITHMLFRLAVPFFMCVSGFFIGQKIQNAVDVENVFKNYRKRLFPSFVFWTIVSEIIYFVKLLSQLDVCRAVLLTVRSSLFYQRGAMWYVSSCIIASWIIEKLIKYKKASVLLWSFSICGYMFALASNTYFFIVKDMFLGDIVDVYLKIFESARNGLFIGVLYLWIGINLAKIESRGHSFKRYAVVILLVSYSLLCVEVLFTYGKEVRDDSSLFLSLPIVISAMIMIAYHIEIKKKLPYRAMRKLSVGIYYPHRTIENLLNLLIGKGELLFVCTLVTVVVMYIVCNKLWKDNKIKNILYPL